MTANITFIDRDQYTTVKVDGRVVGRILLFISAPKGWAYVPKGSKRGETFPTREQCKAHIIGGES